MNLGRDRKGPEVSPLIRMRSGFPGHVFAIRKHVLGGRSRNRTSRDVINAPAIPSDFMALRRREVTGSEAFGNEHVT